MPTFDRGADDAKKRSDETKAKGGRSRIKQITWDDKEEKILRFLNDTTRGPMGIIGLKTHSFIPTKAKPEEYKGDWPESMWAICQNDIVFRIGGVPTGEWEEGYGHCYICANEEYAAKLDRFKKPINRPSDQVYGLAVVRKPIIEGSGASARVVGIEDEYHEWKDADGKLTSIVVVGYVSQKYSNFWASPAAAAYMEPRTILDKDFRILREENNYRAAIANNTPDLRPGTPGWKNYETALAVMGFDLEEYLVGRSDPDWYARWFDPARTPKDGYARQDHDEEEQSGGDGAKPQTSAVQPGFDPDLMKGFADRLAERPDRQTQ
jgi:hypothetical protein